MPGRRRTAERPDAVPVAREMPADGTRAQAIRPDGTLPFLFDGLRVPVPLPPQAAAILPLIDGRRSVGADRRDAGRARHDGAGRSRAPGPRPRRKLVRAQPRPARAAAVTPMRRTRRRSSSSARRSGRTARRATRCCAGCGGAAAFGAALGSRRSFLPTGGVGRHRPSEAAVMAGLLREFGRAAGADRAGGDCDRHALARCGRARGCCGARSSRAGLCGDQRLSPAALPRAAAAGGAVRAWTCPPPPLPAATGLRKRWFWRLREMAALPWDVGIIARPVRCGRKGLALFLAALPLLHLDLHDRLRRPRPQGRRCLPARPPRPPPRRLRARLPHPPCRAPGSLGAALLFGDVAAGAAHARLLGRLLGAAFGADRGRFAEIVELARRRRRKRAWCRVRASPSRPHIGGRARPMPS